MNHSEIVAVVVCTSLIQIDTVIVLSNLSHDISREGKELLLFLRYVLPRIIAFFTFLKEMVLKRNLVWQ